MTIYKPGQGYWTRLLTAIGAGVLVAGGAAWLWGELSVLTWRRELIQSVSVAVLILVAIGIGWWFLNKPSIVDFMIATEAEMRKVNWPTRREIVGSTWVVICGTVLMAVTLFVVDVFFSQLFLTIDILQGQSYIEKLFGG